MAAEVFHSAMEAALKAVPADLRPATTWHGGGPKPVLDFHGWLELALYLARGVAEAEVVALAERVLARYRADPAAETPMMRLMRATTMEERQWVAALVKPARGDLRVDTIAQIKAWNKAAVADAPPARGITLALAREVEEVTSQGQPGQWTRLAAAHAARLAVARGNDAVASYLGALDQEILRAEALTLMNDQGKRASRPITAAVWRGHDGKKPTCVVVRLDDGSFGLLAKLGRAWSFSEGARDEVVATLPPAYMEGAVAAILAQTNT